MCTWDCAQNRNVNVRDAVARGQQNRNETGGEMTKSDREWRCLVDRMWIEYVDCAQGSGHLHL